MVLILPQFIVLEPIDRRDYLTYIRDGGEGDGILKFTEAQAVSPYAQFEVEFTSTNGVVHIRNCKNNKYWERTQNPSFDGSWITATAKKKEEDQTKDSCTLFKFISVDSAKNTVRIVHVQSGCYSCLWGMSENPTLYRCVASNYKEHDDYSRDIIGIVDWTSLLILPRYLAFKGDINKYLCLRHLDGDYPYLQFSSNDIGDSTVACELFTMKDGNICIKQRDNNKFWKRTSHWVRANSDDSTTTYDKDTWFRPVKIDEKTISLFNLGANSFCKRITFEGKTNVLRATAPSIINEARLTVEEPVLTREIYDINYDLDNARIYGETVRTVGEGSDENSGLVDSELDVEVKCEDTKTTTWKASLSLTLGMKATAKAGIPIIAEAKVELSAEFNAGIEWGKTETKTTSFTVTKRTPVPPKTKVTVKAVATDGTCDVPFTYMQKDTLYDGSSVTTECHGIFTGANYYSTEFKPTYEPLE